MRGIVQVFVDNTLYIWNGFMGSICLQWVANYRHMCITVWQVRIGLALVIYEDTYVFIYIYIYCTTVIHNT